MESHVIHSNAVFRINGPYCKGVNDQILFLGQTVKNVKGLIIKGQFCTIESHIIHSNAVFRVNGP